jgi:hypothetical protein
MMPPPPQPRFLVSVPLKTTAASACRLSVHARIAQQLALPEAERAAVAAYGRRHHLPMITTFCYCALRGWGVKLVDADVRRGSVRVRLVDLDLYRACSARVSPRAHPADTADARLKALRLWFPNCPTRERTLQASQPLVLDTQGVEDATKPGRLAMVLRDLMRMMHL